LPIFGEKSVSDRGLQRRDIWVCVVHG